MTEKQTESESCGAAETAAQSAMLAIQTSPRPSKLSHQEVLKFAKHTQNICAEPI